MPLRTSLLRIYWKMERAITPGLPSSLDVYEQALNEHVLPGWRWLDLGCGHHLLAPWKKAQELNLVAKCSQVVGIDADLASLRNHQSVSVRVAGEIGRLPFPDGCFDLATANVVVEHLQDPEAQFCEIGRVLKPGGWFIFRTPHLYGYTTMLARLLPGPLKRKLVYLLEDREESEVFPTYYRANSRAAIQRIAGKSGLEVVDMRMVLAPAEFSLVPPLAFFELLLLRLLMIEALSGLRTSLVAVLRKTPE